MNADTRARTPLADCLACHGTGVVHSKPRGVGIGLRSSECECWRLREEVTAPTTIRCDGLQLGNTDLEPTVEQLYDDIREDRLRRLRRDAP